MNLELLLDLFRALTPYFTFALAIGVGVIAWFIRRLIDETKVQFAELKSDLCKRIDRVEEDIEKLERARQADQKYVYENCVQKEIFYMTVGETKGLMGKIFDELKAVNRLIHQTIGALTPWGGGLGSMGKE